MVGRDEQAQGGEVNVKKKTLLEKYNISYEKLEFKHVRSCNNIKELESIVKILRSHEEGHFPDLTKAAEERLGALSPNNRLLRTRAKALRKSELSKGEWSEIVNEIEEWKDEISLKEKNLVNDTKLPDDIYPEIRRGPTVKVEETQEATTEKTEKKPISTDYRKWDKFNADVEEMKIDLEEERKREEKKIQEKMERKTGPDEEGELEKLKQVAATMTEDEKSLLATKEKELGNDFYNSREFPAAIRHYTRSITMFPTAPGYNNRAATYLKQCNYSKALVDLNRALELEPGNVKAHFRRALCLQHKNEFHRALDDMREVLRKQPSNVVARHIADELREQCSTVPRKVRLRVKNDDPSKEVEYIECTEEEMMRNYQGPKYVEVNEEGLPKVKCANCAAKYAHLSSSHDENTRFQHLKDKNKVQELSPDDNKNIDSREKKNAPKRLNIIEVEKIQDVPESPEYVPEKGSQEAFTKVPVVETEDSLTKEIPECSSLVEVDVDNLPEEEEAKISSGAIPKSEGKARKKEKTRVNEALRAEGDDLSKSSTPISVAKKYQKKNSSKNPDQEKSDETESSGPQDLSQVAFSPLQLWTNWVNIVKEEGDGLQRKASLLRTIRPHLLQATVGTKLDDVILSTFLRCLRNHFNLQDERELVTEYLTAITQLERFKIIYAFLTPEDKSVAKNILEILGLSGSSHLINFFV